MKQFFAQVESQNKKKVARREWFLAPDGRPGTLGAADRSAVVFLLAGTIHVVIGGVEAGEQGYQFVVISNVDAENITRDTAIESCKHSVQGCQFTSVLEAHGIQISMDGKGCSQNNIFVERLWRSVKYERVYLKAFVGGTHLR